jgi:hypothetical protein
MSSNRIKLGKLDPEKIFGSRGEQSQARGVEPENKEEKKRNRALSPESVEVFYRFRNPVETAAEDRVTREVYLRRHGKNYVRPLVPVLVKREERRSKSVVGKEEVSRGREVGEVGEVRGREEVSRGRGNEGRSVGRGRAEVSRSAVENRSREVSRGRGEVGRNRIVIVGSNGKNREEKENPIRERISRGSGERGSGSSALRVDEHGHRSGGPRSTKEESKSMPRIRIEGRGEIESRGRGGNGRSSGRNPGREEKGFTQTITLTFGDQGESHVGMGKIGKKSEHGFSLEDLEQARDWFLEKGFESKIHCLTDELPDGLEHELNLDAPPAFILIARGGANAFVDADELFEEHINLEYDTKFWDKRRGKVLNKLARHNLLFGETAQTADFENKVSTVVAYKDVPLLNKIREGIPDMIGEVGKDLVCESNLYYSPTTDCGIGIHMDLERTKVIAVRLGQTMKLRFYWFHRFKPVSKPIDFVLNHSDVYICSRWAVSCPLGNKSSILVLKHCAGADKYLEWKGKSKKKDQEEGSEEEEE